MNLPIISLEIRLEADVVLARQRARQIAALLGFNLLDQTRIATATSEIARNSVQYAGGGRIEFGLERGAIAYLVVRVHERGPGIKDLQAILDGHYESSTGLGLGITGARRLMDRFAIESVAGAGVMVVMAKGLPQRAPLIGPEELGRLSAELARNAPRGMLEELQQQNQELLNALEELRSSQSEIELLHSRELEETNRGVLALYAELDEGAKALKRLSDLKSRFLSETSHEFRSPLNSIKGLTGLLLSRTDGDLTAEQEKQIEFIQQATEGLSTLVDDLLDLARVEAGKATVRISSFRLSELFEILDGTIRPTIDAARVSLVFEDPGSTLAFETDEGKVSQILRNFLSNAVKFTERGEIRVSARQGPGDVVAFSVTDTGIGIAAENLDRIFDEYGQIDNPLQHRAKGMGLGLPLTRKLAQLLGGNVFVRSEVGSGSEFRAQIPRVFNGGAGEATGAAGLLHREDETGGATGLENERFAGAGDALERGALEVALVVDDAIEHRYLIKGILAALKPFEIIEANSGEAGLRLAGLRQPHVIFLDLGLPDMTGFEVLDRLKSDERTTRIPVIVHTSKALDPEERGRLVRKSVAIIGKGSKSRETAIAEVRESLCQAGLQVYEIQEAAES